MRAWRLITLVAAKQVPSTYCSYVYGKQLIDDLGSKDAVMAVQRDFRSAGLSGKEVAMLDYAEDRQERGRGLAGRHRPLARRRIHRPGGCDIALCASFRCFVSRYFDAVGAGPEAVYIDSDPAFRGAMTVGKKFETI